MTTFSTDTLLHIIKSTADINVGLTSSYTDKVHPGSNQRVEGWKWDRASWPTNAQFKGMGVVPSLWDPSTSGIQEDYFQSGYGDNDDLTFLGVEPMAVSSVNSWAPKIHHGYFYSNKEEWYLYSDSYQTSCFSAAIDGQQYIDLDYTPKPTIPIRVRRYYLDKADNRHRVDLDFRKVTDFTTSGTEPEFTVDTDYSPPRLWLDKSYATEIGKELTLISGVIPSSVDDLYSLEFLGISNGGPSQSFSLSTSPVDPFADVHIYTYLYSNQVHIWTSISGVDEFSLDGQEVKVDHDWGTILFGNQDPVVGTGTGKIPPEGHRVLAHYTKGVAAHYEPEKTRDYILAPEANLDPTRAATHRGFVQISTVSQSPASITLESEDLSGSSNPTYLIDIGNNTGTLLATVYNKASEVLEGETVSFDIIGPAIGSLGADDISTSAVTNSLGQARAVYTAPQTIENIGQATLDVVSGTANTIVRVQGITDPDNVSGIYLYKVHMYDKLLGIPASGVDQYYTDYLGAENIVSGDTASQSFEEDYRDEWNLPRPTSYDVGDIITGKKTILLTSARATVIDPETGDQRDSLPYPYAPLYPTLVSSIGTTIDPGMELTYDTRLTVPPDTSDGTKSYFVVAEGKTFARAKVTNRHTGEAIYSNTIGIKALIPDSVNGTYYANQLSDVVSGLLRNVRDINDFTDAQILATSGVNNNWDNYISERRYQRIPDHKLQVRWKGGTKGPPQSQLIIKLFCDNTEILSQIYYSHSSSFTTETRTLTDAEVLAITDYDNLKFHIISKYSDLSGPHQLSWARLFTDRTVGYDLLAQEVSLVSDISTGQWYSMPVSGQNLYTQIDEETVSDTDYITAGNYPSTTCEMTFDSLTDPRYEGTGFEIYLDWFKRTRRGDTTGLEAAGYSLLRTTVSGTFPADIPLGFRLKSTGLTAASVLDRITYVSPNSVLASTYWPDNFSEV